MKLSILIVAVLTIVVVSGSPVVRSESNRGFFDDLLAQLTQAAKQIHKEILLPAIDNQVKNVALLAAQVLAGLCK